MAVIKPAEQLKHRKVTELAVYNRARLMAYQDEQRIKLHNYKVDRYKVHSHEHIIELTLPIKTIMQLLLSLSISINFKVKIVWLRVLPSEH